MRFLSARGLVAACTVSGAALALAMPGTALAKENPLCNGANIEGQGASTQKIVQQNHWNPEFNTNTKSKQSCTVEGKKPTVKYNSTGSGAGLKSWGIEPKEGETPNFGEKNAYLGTDEPPSASQITELESHESTPTAGTVLTIPVMQVAVTVMVHLPEGCEATSTVTPGRLVVSQKQLEEIYSGAIKTFGGLTAGGDKVTCPEATLTPVVRQDQSGTTHIFKRFLNLVDGEALETAKGPKTWGELSEGSLNTTWPTAAATVHAEKSGGGELVKYVAEHAGTVGYASLADARANKAFSEGGAGKATFWAELENENKKGKAKFQEPSTNGETNVTASANCKKTLYSNGANPFPPPSVTEPWNEVTSKTSEKTYPLCGFSFDVSVSMYGLLPGTSAAEAETVKAYEKYVTDKKGGQVALGINDYFALPKEVLAIAVGGTNLIGD
jgi:ABC-type phosphate transport system substrate-binding protein